MKNPIRKNVLLILAIFFMLFQCFSFGRVSCHIKANIPDIATEHNFAVLDELPISLDDLYHLDNYTLFEQMLDAIEFGNPFWPIKPYGTFFGHSHAEGLARMDFNPHGHHVNIRAPADGIIDFYLTQNGSIEIIKDHQCVMDCSFAFNIGNDCFLSFGHVDLLKNHWDALEASNNLTLNKGDLIGFTSSVGSESIVDFSYWYKGIAIPPHYAFTPKLLGKVEILYNFVFERAKMNGLFPRAYMINEMFIHKDDEFWGNWYYKTGPYDSYINPEVHISAYDFGVLTFLNREFTSPETYWKDFINPNKNLTVDIVGVGRNHDFAFTPGYKSAGEGHILLIEGDNSSGILELRTFYPCDYGPTNTSVYGRFEVQVNNSNVVGDELKIEFFPTLGEAQSGFTSNASTYYRIYTPTLEDIELPPSTIPTKQSILYTFPAIFALVITVIITPKKKRIE